MTSSSKIGKGKRKGTLPAPGSAAAPGSGPSTSSLPAIDEDDDDIMETQDEENILHIIDVQNFEENVENVVTED